MISMEKNYNPSEKWGLNPLAPYSAAYVIYVHYVESIYYISTYIIIYVATYYCANYETSHSYIRSY